MSGPAGVAGSETGGNGGAVSGDSQGRVTEFVVAGLVWGEELVFDIDEEVRGLVKDAEK